MNKTTCQWSLNELLGTWASSRAPDVEVTGVNLDSRLLDAGDAYLAVAGATTHGLHYALQAVDAGAVAVLVADASDPKFFGHLYTNL